MTAAVIAYKGFDMDWKCRDMQYAVGQTFEHTGTVKACEGGLHACEDPLHVLRYYRPGESRFAIVEASGEIDRHDEDSKIAAQRLTVKEELTLPGLIEAAIEYRFAKSTANTDRATKRGECATASGYSGAATASGDYGAATASGYSGAATADNKTAAAMASGRNGKARGKDGAALFLVYRDEDWNIVHARALIVGRDGIKADTWYRLDAEGNAMEVTQ